ncbi:MAG TPA: phosphoribosyltransferase family protein [Eubacteriales bacterium]|mgnify:CR=1 FL=1|jgi:adenine phosphoribosyltransferase|nr:phosphoribosyltransferase family protein [Clostridia bacterium]HRR90486.1 phosphoribosyltransferase family protein [Eubacteriales bacterium]HRU84476.1 phosphoribosyltransferase family protein [Eubacteriales bacterium]
MEEKYKVEIAGIERELVICPLNERLSIAAFVMFSDVEITVAAAEALLKKAPEFDVILTAESKGIPLAYEMARQSGKNYVLARKSAKLYMKEPISIDVQSITTSRIQTLYLDKADAEYLKGKKVLIVDDVISTGESLHAMETLLNKTGAIIAGKMAVLAEGDAAKRTDIVFLNTIPLFIK